MRPGSSNSVRRVRAGVPEFEAVRKEDVLEHRVGVGPADADGAGCVAFAHGGGEGDVDLQQVDGHPRGGRIDGEHLGGGGGLGSRAVERGDGAVRAGR